MKIRIITIGLLLACPLAFQACTNTQPTYYNSYPAYSGIYDSEPKHGYEPYTSAPYDPYGGYYQNFYPSPTYYEPPYHERHCDDRPCAPAPPLPEPDSIKPRLIAPPPERHAASAPSTISRSRPSSPSRGQSNHRD